MLGNSKVNIISIRYTIFSYNFSSDPLDSVKYVFVDNYCADSFELEYETLSIIETEHGVGISIQSFVFPNHICDEIYIHCDVSIVQFLNLVRKTAI